MRLNLHLKQASIGQLIIGRIIVFSIQFVLCLLKKG